MPEERGNAEDDCRYGDETNDRYNITGRASAPARVVVWDCCRSRCL
jgi:hypothetical protein